MSGNTVTSVISKQPAVESQGMDVESARQAPVVDEQPKRSEQMVAEPMSLRGGGGGLCCGICAGIACFECCECCC